MTNEEFNELFRKRTLAFAVRVIIFLESVPFNSATRVMSFQLCKAATSTGANFRAFSRGRSKNEKLSKICIVVEEADETDYWLELFTHTNYGNQQELRWLCKEALELLKVTSSIKTSFYR